MPIKLNAATGGGSVSLSAPNSTTSNADVTLTLPPNDGDASQYLQTNGSGTLSFAGVSGRILNTYTATDTAGRTTTSTTFTAASNTASVTLTPASSSSKFLVIVTGTCGSNDGNDAWMVTLFRDTNNLATTAAEGFFQGNSVPGITGLIYPFTIVHLDSPNTTDEIVYQPQIRVIDADSDGGSVRIGYGGDGAAGGPATVTTVLEIGG